MASGTKSQDGFSWTPSGGLSEGLPTIGLVKPPSYFAPESRNGIFDVTVVGSGYAGLVAARDLATQGTLCSPKIQAPGLTHCRKEDVAR
jgi:hypothetical protein